MCLKKSFTQPIGTFLKSYVSCLFYVRGMKNSFQMGFQIWEIKVSVQIARQPCQYVFTDSPVC